VAWEFRNKSLNSVLFILLLSAVSHMSVRSYMPIRYTGWSAGVNHLSLIAIIAADINRFCQFSGITAVQQYKMLSSDHKRSHHAANVSLHYLVKNNVLTFSAPL